MVDTIQGESVNNKRHNAKTKLKRRCIQCTYNVLRYVAFFFYVPFDRGEKYAFSKYNFLLFFTVIDIGRKL